MRLLICLVSGNDELRREFSLARDRVVSPASLSKGFFGRQGTTLSTVAFSASAKSAPADLEVFLLGRSQQADFCIVLVERGYLGLTVRCTPAMLVAGFGLDEVGDSRLNFSTQFWRVR